MNLKFIFNKYEKLYENKSVTDILFYSYIFMSIFLSLLIKTPLFKKTTIFFFKKIKISSNFVSCLIYI